MKIQCDVCNKEEASVFCSADEAALCNNCDHRVHHANKLASKHHRFSLLYPSNKDAPRCDVCQERRAFVFCREDRAILCRECDYPIHTANEHTQKHSRFLLTGVKLSPSNSCYDESNKTLMKKNDMVVSESSEELHDPPPSIDKTNSTQSKGYGGDDYVANTTTSGGGSTSSIAEYLIETLPGWHVEDFLDSSSAPSLGFCKNDNLMPFLDADLETKLGNFSSDELTIWVPEISPPFHQFPQNDEQKNGLFKEMKDLNNTKVCKRWSDHGFTVPQISPPINKRSRTLW